MSCLTFETASRCDLRKRGAWVYSQDQSTFICCAGYKLVIDGKPQPTRVLSEAEFLKPDPALLALAQDPEVIFMAHNCSFECGMWEHHAVPAGYPPLPPERWHDTMATAAMKGLPLGLDALTTALELPVRKDMEGHALMMKLCKPDRDDTWQHHTPDAIARLKTYNIGDCDGQYASYVATGGLGASERGTWIADQRINQRGIKVDREFVHACMDVLDQVRVPMVARFRELTGGLNPTQREKVLNWVNDQGVRLGDVKKATLDAILDPADEFDIGDFDEPLPYNVHEVLTLRRSLASSSVAKLQRMLDCTGVDGRVRYTMQYHGARTGRWAGRLIQIQNYPRGEISERQGLTAEILADAILTRNVDNVRELWGDDIFSAVISSLRSCIVPEKGNILVAGDFAQVEAKNLLTMAGQHDKAQLIHSGADSYAEMASLIYKRPINKSDNPMERQVGKNCVMGNGYGLGPVGFRARFIPKEPLELAQLAVDAYRKDFAPMVPKFWYGLWQASVDAVWCSHAKTYEYAGVSFRKENDFLTMLLPSSRKIYYHRPRIEKTIAPYDGLERPSWSFMSYQGKKFRRHLAWHGLVTADCIQGLSRDLTVHAIKLSERENYPTIFSAHDEIAWEVPDNGTDYAKVQKQLMEDTPDWARERKLLVTAACDSMYRYRK
jgi:DNA polymerase bacteriophage-type